MLYGSKSYSFEVDSWSFGCILAELYLGFPLLTGKNELLQIVQIAKLIGPPSEEEYQQLSGGKKDNLFNFTSKDKGMDKLLHCLPGKIFGIVESLLRYRERKPLQEIIKSEFYVEPSGPIPDLHLRTSRDKNIKLEAYEDIFGIYN